MKSKKYLGMLGIGCAALLLTGCGSGKQLKCEMDMSDELAGLGTMKMELIIDYDKNGETAEKATMKMEIDITTTEVEVTDEQMDSLEKSLEKNCEEEDFDSCTVKRDGKKVTLTATSSKPEDVEASANRTYEEAKKELTEEGYTCK